LKSTRRFRGAYCPYHLKSQSNTMRLHGAIFQKALTLTWIRYAGCLDEAENNSSEPGLSFSVSWYQVQNIHTL
jgi:hypothetical protein